ncbi:hypothetical protein SAMN00768000_3446 [Sulfobacillus thermosulfidooxidans DSM 9293]|uniref:Zinc-ribbon domain-containing protein n=1 Tax=Sulfobacillus thermosulfidooxidans (strain DSM 9293 / VKM B-1269 / AT-1) TaxID=929705 RepID=A0A1W1WMW5_SULTA|nr:hypothetical protein [Sulfobacillus thermosulfidooxidans]SMC07565.1 hypothetical protein SAMN00768000_3446 [Sulfobacillus thermosulfidooxidans DSM 9293]
MTCEHCGSLLSRDESTCPQCGFEVPSPAPIKKSAKVVPFRPRKKRRRPSPPKGRYAGGPVFWWIVAIIAISLLLPYIIPMHP